MNYVNAPTQAPAGGAISPLNGEFYEGGQFMCNQFAMPKGYTKHLKRAAAKRTVKTDNIAQIFVAGAHVAVRMAGESRCEVVFHGSGDQCKTFAGLLKQAKQDQAAAQGIAVHPTEIVFQQ